MRKIITFRSQAMGGVHDLIGDEGLVCQASQDLIFQLAGELVDYKEEGVELAPVVLFCQNISQLIGSLPGPTTYEIGKALLSASSVKQILKDCAPLSTANWHIFIERSEANSVTYGVFRYRARPTTLPLQETISVISGQFGVVITKTGKSGVQISGSKGGRITLLFSTERDDQPTDDAIGRFCSDCSKKIQPKSEKPDFLRYLQKAVERALTRSHGTILLCATAKSIERVSQLKDQIKLEPPVCIFTPFLDYKKTESADAVLDLQCTEELMQGFMNSDGMVLFNEVGEIFGYKAFYRGSGASAEVVGGARRRAFEAIRAMVGKKIVSALFRSQDGNMIYLGGSKK